MPDVATDSCWMLLGLEQADFSRLSLLPIQSQLTSDRSQLEYAATFTAVELPFQYVFTFHQTIPMTVDTLRRILSAISGQPLQSTTSTNAAQGTSLQQLLLPELYQRDQELARRQELMQHCFKFIHTGTFMEGVQVDRLPFTHIRHLVPMIKA